MTRRENLERLLGTSGPWDYVPAAFFMHFGHEYAHGQAAASRHLEYFRATGMDFVKVQYEKPFPSSPSLLRPSDWRAVRLQRPARVRLPQALRHAGPVPQLSGDGGQRFPPEGRRHRAPGVGPLPRLWAARHGRTRPKGHPGLGTRPPTPQRGREGSGRPSSPVHLERRLHGFGPDLLGNHQVCGRNGPREWSQAVIPGVAFLRRKAR